ncbi:DUF389 domain-containing protein [archaeon]|nr:MAG: DUF389 domain-containing protein [archaeon]
MGVAISASLLPPAVNCGIALAYAAIGYTHAAMRRWAGVTAALLSAEGFRSLSSQ